MYINTAIIPQLRIKEKRQSIFKTIDRYEDTYTKWKQIHTHTQEEDLCIDSDACM